MIWSLVLGYLKRAFGNRYVQMALVALLLAGGGYAAGRYAQPAKVVATEKVVTVTQDRVVYQDRVVVKEVEVAVEKKDRHTDTTVTKSPDGTVVIHTTTDTETDKNVNTTVDKTVAKEKVEDKKTETTLQKTQVTESKQLDWIVHGGVGISVPVFLGQQQQGVPGLRGAVIQVGIDRRVVGPFYLGVYGDTQGVVGARLTGAF